MRPFLVVVLFFAFLSAIPLQASSEMKKGPRASELKTVHTYGGGDLLEKTFHAIKMLIYGNTQEGLGGTFSALLRVALSVGAFSAIILAFAKGSYEPFVKGWLIPALAICGILLVPRTDIYIHDHLVEKTANSQLRSVSKVENVPFFFGTIISLVSWVSYTLTQAIEDVSHSEHDPIYNWTGAVYAGDALFKAGQVQLSNPVVEENIKNFCYHCVFNDLTINPPSYTRQELNDTTDLLQFLYEKTNPWLSFPYREGDGTTNYVRCHIGIEKIKNRIEGAVMTKPLSYISYKLNAKREKAAQATIFANIAPHAQTLLGHSNQALANQKKFVIQQYMIDAVQKYPNPQYSTYRAKQIQSSHQNILGSLGGSIVGMRNLFEALIYFSFPLIIIFSLASFGFKALANWMQFLLWIMLWPPFYVIVNFFQQCLWTQRLKHIFGTSEVPLSIFTSSGLEELYASMEGVASMALFLVPWLAFAFTKGGVHSLVHLANSINAPAQSAAATAANEQVSGNYSMGNISYGNRSFSKMTGANWDNNASLSQGKTTVADGFNATSVNTEGDVLLNRGMSSTGTSVNMTETMGSAVREGYNEAQSAVETTESALSQSRTDTLSSAESFYKAIDSGGSFSFMTNKNDQKAAQNTWDQIQSDMESLRTTKGSSGAMTVKGGWDSGIFGKAFGLSAGAEGSLTRSSGTEKSESAELSNRIGQNFQELSQLCSNYSEGNTLSELQKSAQDFSHNMGNVESLTEQHRSAVSHLDTASTALENWESSSVDTKSSLDNQFVEHLFDKHGDKAYVASVLKNPTIAQQEAQEFAQNYYEKTLLPSVRTSPKAFSSSRIDNSSLVLGEGGEEVLSNIEDGKGNLVSSLAQQKETIRSQTSSPLSFPQEKAPPEGYTGRTDQKEVIQSGSFGPGNKKMQAAARQLIEDNKHLLPTQAKKPSPSIGSEAWNEQQYKEKIQNSVVFWEKFNEEQGEKTKPE